MVLFPDFLAKAKNLTTQGKLMDATRAIQQGLGLKPQTVNDVESFAQPSAGERRAAADVFAPAAGVEAATDIDFREIPSPAGNAQHESKPNQRRPGSFTAGAFVHGQDHYVYRLFVPSTTDDAPLPLVVMLHGCKQDSADFARGTAMNEVAESEKFMVLYPEQLKKSNNMGCWNWFEPAHQARGEGEPAMLAALVSKVISSNRVDASRVYIAGLSAGGAMAALMGRLYPEIFAAVGVHSGLAPGAARNVPSAYAAMAKGPGPRSKVAPIGVPVIILQGSGDSTVAPANADAIIGAEVSAWASKGTPLTRQRREVATTSQRSSDTFVWADHEGKAIIESWTIQAGPHAWSGGSASGSFTDQKGPSATRAMVDFFMRHSRADNLSRPPAR
jgi:poly(hydroxyalkanoate) depolymerase family esterase